LLIWKNCLLKYCCGSGSVSGLDPDSITLWIRIRIRIGSGFNDVVDPDPDWAKFMDPDPYPDWINQSTTLLKTLFVLLLKSYEDNDVHGAPECHQYLRCTHLPVVLATKPNNLFLIYVILMKVCWKFGRKQFFEVAAQKMLH
jgi:hypothetical protein